MISAQAPSTNPDRPIIVDTIQTLPKGGYIIAWREHPSAVQHNTFTTDPTAWLEGYRQGKSLMELQELTARNVPAQNHNRP